MIASCFAVVVITVLPAEKRGGDFIVEAEDVWRLLYTSFDVHIQFILKPFAKHGLVFCKNIVEITTKSSVINAKETCSDCMMAFPFLYRCLDYASSFQRTFFALMPYHICQNICSH